MKNDLYDSLVTECGEAVNETVKTVTGNEVMQELKKVDKTVNSYAYGSSGPIPGDTIDSYLDDVSNVKKENAIKQYRKNVEKMNFMLKSKNYMKQYRMELNFQMKKDINYIHIKPKLFMMENGLEVLDTFMVK